MVEAGTAAMVRFIKSLHQTCHLINALVGIK